MIAIDSLIISPQLHCCGVASWKDYAQILGKDEVPKSCCDPAKTAATECNTFRVDPDEEIADHYFYTTVTNVVACTVDSIIANCYIL
jgi:hypothetical protein